MDITHGRGVCYIGHREMIWTLHMEEGFVT